MTNLSDLFPSGGGKTVSFTASGNITAAGKPVIINTDGTVTEVSGSAFSKTLTTTEWADGYIGTYVMSACYDTTNDVVIVAYQRLASNALTIVAGSISSGTITWGTPELLGYGATDQSYGITFHPSQGAFCVCYQEYTLLKAMCGTVSGTTITLDHGNALTVASATHTRVRSVFDATNDKTLLYCRDGSSYGQCYAISVSTTTPTSSSVYNWTTSTNTYDSADAVHDPDEERIVIAYRGSGTIGNVVLVDCSAATPTGTSPIAITPYASSGYAEGTISYDTGQNKAVIGVYDSDNSNYLSYVVATIDASGSTATFGSKVTQTTTYTRWPTYSKMIYDPDNAINVISFQDGGTYGSYVQTATVSGTTVSISALGELRAADSTYGNAWVLNTMVYDPDEDDFIFVYIDKGDSDECFGLTFSPGSTNLTSTNFVGVSDAAITSSASGDITVRGGIASAGLSSLTIGSKYYVQNAGTITTVSSDVTAGLAISATSLILSGDS